MRRILVINPNRSEACTAGIDAAVSGWRRAGGPVVDVVGLAEGPPAVLSWRDWHGVVEPLCRRVEAEAADCVVIACASDPGLEAVRAVTRQPVLGVFRCAVAAALVRAERFGVIAIVEASKARHLAALRAMGVEGRLAAEVAVEMPMEALLDPVAARAGLVGAARACVAAGAGVVVLGCTGMAGHRRAVEDAVGVGVVEPCEAGVAMALVAVGG